MVSKNSSLAFCTEMTAGRAFSQQTKTNSNSTLTVDGYLLPMTIVCLQRNLVWSSADLHLMMPIRMKVTQFDCLSKVEIVKVIHWFNPQFVFCTIKRVV